MFTAFLGFSADTPADLAKNNREFPRDKTGNIFLHNREDYPAEQGSHGAQTGI
ncbi:MAG: hypothetical protein ABL882_07120 [Sphingopyxis sp.]